MTIEQQQSDQDPPVPVNVNGYVDIQSLHVLAVNENHQDGNENQQEPNQNQNQDKEKEDVQMISDAPSNNTGGNDAPVDLEASHDEVTIAGSSNSNVKIQVINPTFVQSWSNEQLQQNMLVLLQEQTRRNNNKSNMADATTTTGHMDRNEIWKIQMAEMQQAQAILRRSSQSQSLGLPLPAGLSLPVLTTYDHQHQHQKQQQQGLPNINNVTQSGGNAVDASNNNTATPSNYGGIMQQSQSLASLPTATAPKTKLSQFGFPCLNMSYGNGGAMPTAPAQTPNYQDFGSGALKVLGGTSSNTNAPDVMKSSMQNASSQAQAPTQNLVKEGSSLLTFCKPKRKPLRPGLTASNRERQFVNHDYQDYCMEEPSNHEANLDMFYETKATINGPSIVKPIESVQRLAFPLKLHLGLTAIEDAGFTHIISWQPHGRAVLIHQPKDFEEQIMENFFAMKKLTSFQRQLNLYGFRRITCGADAGSYYHDMFLRGKAFLCRRMQRIKIKGNGFKAAAKPECEPDFYKMLPCRDPMRLNNMNNESSKITTAGANQGTRTLQAKSTTNGQQKGDSVAAATALLSFATPTSQENNANDDQVTPPPQNNVVDL